MGDRVWLHLCMERLQGLAKNLKLIRYGSFDIIDQVSKNASKLNLHAYMNIYFIFNMNNLKLFESSILNEEEEVAG